MYVRAESSFRPQGSVLGHLPSSLRTGGSRDRHYSVGLVPMQNNSTGQIKISSVKRYETPRARAYELQLNVVVSLLGN